MWYTFVGVPKPSHEMKEWMWFIEPHGKSTSYFFVCRELMVPPQNHLWKLTLAVGFICVRLDFGFTASTVPAVSASLKSLLWCPNVFTICIHYICDAVPESLFALVKYLFFFFWGRELFGAVLSSNTFSSILKRNLLFFLSIVELLLLRENRVKQKLCT